MNIAELGVIIGGVLAPIFTAVYFLLKEIRKIRARNRIKLNGTWTNEGDVTSTERDYITIELNVDKDDGEILGLAHCRSFIPTETQSINGKMGLGSAIIYIGRVSHQQYIESLKARVTIKGKNLKWKVIRDNYAMKPHKTILFRSSST
jgi:hypothetical protein